MGKENVIDEFLDELRKLQDKYDVYIFADAYEEWDEDYNGDLFCLGFNPYLCVEYNNGKDSRCLYTNIVQ